MAPASFEGLPERASALSAADIAYKAELTPIQRRGSVSQRRER